MMRRCAVVLVVAMLPLLSACDTPTLPLLPGRDLGASDTIELTHARATIGGPGVIETFTVRKDTVQREVQLPGGATIADITVEIDAQQREAIEDATETYRAEAGTGNGPECSDVGSLSVVITGDVEYESSRADCLEDEPSPGDIIEVVLNEVGTALPEVVRPDVPWSITLRDASSGMAEVLVEGGHPSGSAVGEQDITVTRGEEAPEEETLSPEESANFLRVANDAVSTAEPGCPGAEQTLTISGFEGGPVGSGPIGDIPVCPGTRAQDLAELLEE